MQPLLEFVLLKLDTAAAAVSGTRDGCPLPNPTHHQWCGLWRFEERVVAEETASETLTSEDAR